MLLRGPRLEGDCFPSDKNHLAPSKEPATAGPGQQRTEQAHRSAALAQRQCTQAGEEAHAGLKQYHGSAT